MQAETILPRASVHVASDLEHISKDSITVVGGPYVSGTVLAEKDDGTYTQLNIDASAVEANMASRILYGHKRDKDAGQCLAHARVCSMYSSKLTWPEGITQEQLESAEKALTKNHIVLR
ncbi:head decoration protein [Pseudoalteromonas umbrosa]|uniref:head decoration protein n=1 Tax=Pseudoalteromonas umbrosa TaxID=3048489 RepID=UPI0024C26128|nr:head decoration protein [Pseudoalteromonas sp. B95]MDK1289786.1 head decoration protein [Pseudoalteromonas sp. B95]